MIAMNTKLKRWVPLAPLVLTTIVVAHRSIKAVIAKVGFPGPSLDDAYIHFQYARAFAEGHPFRFQAGEPISTGATSFLWPLVLAPFYLVGLRGEAIMWPAWLLSFAALGGLSYETYFLTKPLAGKVAAIGAGGMVLAFGGFVWGAASGMEVVPFAWLIAGGMRRAAEWAEDPEKRTTRHLKWLVFFAVACPLMRPEGGASSAAIMLVVLFNPREAKKRWEAGYFLLATILPQLILLVLTGHATSSTAQVKLLPGNPYFVLSDAVMANAKLLINQILDGQVWSAEFLPRGGSVIACVGLIAISWRGYMSNHWVRAALVVLMATSMFIPCFYATFLWNRLRYLWPFATGWLIGLACLARACGTIATYIDRRLAPAVVALAAGAFGGMLLVRLEWVIDDVAQSASGIERQQSTLGRWAKVNLPKDARIGLNDTGAIAYFSERKTFDVVGLTTPGEGRYWIGGAASRFEHYEKMDRAKLPTHFIVYPEWMSCQAVLGKTLTEATVTDSTILGGATMRAYEARWDSLHTGDTPWTPLAKIEDTLDVADLESEADHKYELLGAHEGEQSVAESPGPPSSKRVIADGGRTNRIRERFTMTLSEKLIMRIDATAQTTVRVKVGDKAFGAQSESNGPWEELVIDVPPDVMGANKVVEVEASAPFTSFHYWSGI